MGDLAPFVAAAIRDRVVHEQHEQIQTLTTKLEDAQEENDELKTLLLRQNPVKHISICGLNNKVYAQAELNVVSYDPTETGAFSHTEDIFFSLNELMAIEFRIDGRPAIRLFDMDCHAGNYIYCDQSIEYFVCLEFDTPGLSVRVYLAPFPPDFYTRLTGSTEPPINPSCMMINHDRFRQRLDPRMILEFTNTSVQAKMPFDDGEFKCTPEFVERSFQTRAAI